MISFVNVSIIIREFLYSFQFSLAWRLLTLAHNCVQLYYYTAILSVVVDFNFQSPLHHPSKNVLKKIMFMDVAGMVRFLLEEMAEGADVRNTIYKQLIMLIDIWRMIYHHRQYHRR